MCQIKWERLAVLRKDVKLSATDFVVDLSLSFRSIVYTVGPLVATTSPQRPVFQNTKSFQVKSLYLEPLVSGRLP